MTQILLIRHAANDYTKTDRLAGRTPGVFLNDEGIAQAEALGKRLKHYPIKHLYSSPLERTIETAEAIARHQPHLEIKRLDGIGEVDYGDWQGEAISNLARRKMWHLIQEYPSRAYFPNGETLRAVQARAVDTLEQLALAHPAEMIAVLSHADVIKMGLAHYLGMHLDYFQRIVISTASISTLMLGYGRPYVGSINDIAHVARLKHGQTRENHRTQPDPAPGPAAKT